MATRQIEQKVFEENKVGDEEGRKQNKVKWGTQKMAPAVNFSGLVWIGGGSSEAFFAKIPCCHIYRVC